MLPEEKSAGHTPSEAKTLSISLLLWVGAAALVVMMLFAYFRT
ncbi:hypothetical protein [Tardiphaga alba]|nr:hypothetical protein [Tardiphaga alba]